MVYIKCCHYCFNRTPTCHSTCETYAKEKQAGKERLEAIKKAKADEKAVREVRNHAYQMHQRKKHGG